MAGCLGAASACDGQADQSGAEQQSRVRLRNQGAAHVDVVDLAEVALAIVEPESHPDHFVVGQRKALAGDGKLPTARALRRTAEIWRPWRAYAAMLLWSSLSALPRKMAKKEER